ncbi:MAG: recombinase family protein [Solirubrobacterales bacterium]|nr:recombinase family protein [Solirubrobacterales bacterium]
MSAVSPTGAAITPAVVYAAKSTQDRHNSIKTQIEEATEMAEKEGWEVVATYQDEGFSAYSGNRGPGLKQAIDAAAAAAHERGTTAMLVAQAHDRFARGAGDRPGAPQALGEIWFRTRRLNVELRTVEDDDDLRDQERVGAIGKRAHVDSLRKSRSVTKGMQRRAERGLPTGGTRPYGYRWARENQANPLEIDPAEKDVVVRVFDDYTAGVSQNSIMRALNAEGIPSATGKTWYQGTISNMLNNPTYVGMIPHKGEVYQGRHEPIITDATWKAAQTMLAVNRLPRGRGGGRPVSGSHLLDKGLLRCGTCGSAMITVTKPTRTSGTYEVYDCSGRKRHSVEYCPQTPVPRTEIDGPLLTELTRHYLDLESTRRLIATRVVADVGRVETELHSATMEMGKTQDKLSRLERDYESGDLDARLATKIHKRLLSEQQAQGAQVERLQRHAADLREQAPLLDGEAQLLQHLAAMREAIADGFGKAPNIAALRRLLHDVFSEIRFYDLSRPLPAWIEHPHQLDAGTFPETSTGLLSLHPWLERSDENRRPLPIAETELDGLVR